MSLATCSGNLSRPQCLDCARLRIRGLMRPVAPLRDCALFEPTETARKRMQGRKPKPIRYAGAPA